MSIEGASFAGDVTIHNLVIVTSNGTAYDMNPHFLELNIFEDIFSPSMSGNMIIADTLGLVEKLPIIGEEYLTIEFETQATDVRIRKNFRIYKMENRELVASDRVQTYILHFVSPESQLDSLIRIYKTYNGNTNQIADQIYRDYLQTAKAFEFTRDSDGNITGLSESTENNELITSTTSSNLVKYTSMGWGGIKNLCWLASKTMGSVQNACDTLFFETNKNHYFSSISEIIKKYKDAGVVAADYYLIPKNQRGTIGATVKISGAEYTPAQTNVEYKIVESMRVLDSFDTMRLMHTGYYANRQINVDIINKAYKYNDFDYIKDFQKYTHLQDQPTFTQYQYRSPLTNVNVEVSHPRLYDGALNNANERVNQISQNRNSLLTGYASTFRLEISVPGRSDLECGSVIYFQMPEAGDKETADSSTDGVNVDEYFSGLYLIGSIRHKITQNRYVQTLEIVKDSIGKSY